MEVQLKAMICTAISDGTLWTNQWSKMPLPVYVDLPPVLRCNVSRSSLME